MSVSINQIQDEIIEELSLFDDWMDKYEQIIDYGKGLESMPDVHKIEQNLVKGCQSKVWLHAYMEDNKLHFLADSDAIITKGLVGLLVRVLSGHAPADIAKADLYFVEKIGLSEHLTPSRSNGFAGMISKMKTYAVAFSANL